MPSNNSHITRDNLDAIIKDRSRIVDNYIKSNPHHGRHYYEAFAGMVFYEAGWDWTVAGVIGKDPEFHVRTYDPEA